MNNRPEWTDYFMGLAFLIGSRSRDPDTQHGSVIVDSYNTIIGTGYNSFVAGVDDSSWPVTRPEKYSFMIHSEENAILNASQRLRSTESTIYITGKPCLNCVQRIIQSGIKRIVYADRQGTKLETKDTDEAIQKFFDQSGVKVEKVSCNLGWAINFLSKF